MIKMTIREIKKILRKKAEQSVCRFKIAAVGFNNKGEIVRKSTNKHRFLCPHGGIHAEQFLFNRNIKKIYILRLGRGGDILPIKPCKKCLKIAKKYNIEIKSIN